MVQAKVYAPTLRFEIVVVGEVVDPIVASLPNTGFDTWDQTPVPYVGVFPVRVVLFKVKHSF